MPEAFPAWFTAKPESPSGEAISLLPTIVSITVVRDPASPLLKPIPIGIFPATPPGSARQLTLGPGNVLLLAQQIATNSPADSITGFRIKSGTLTFPANITVVSGVVHIAPAETIQLDAVLDPPAAPPPVAGPGADATAAVATLPASVRIVFAPAGGQITTLPAFSAKVYGTSVALTHSLTAPHFDQLLQQILVPASAIPETFTIAADQSTLLALSGSAPITGGAWSLPVAAGLPPPGTILGAGNVAILLGSGLQVQWTDVQPFIAQSASVLVGPGQIGVMLTFATQPFSETFQLWQEQGGARNSTIEFDYPAQFTVPYESQAGQEKLPIANGSAVLHLDRPLHADGTRFALPASSASLTLLLDTSGLNVTLAGVLVPPPNDPPIPMALENALLRVQSPQAFSLTGTLSGLKIPAGTLGLNFPLLAIIATLPDPYAASVPASVLARRGNTQGPLSATITWITPASAQLAFSYQQTGGTTFESLPALLDVSSNADQWGVKSTSDAISRLNISQLTLEASAAVLGLFTVPEISWEPMSEDPSSPPPAGSLISPDGDGGPSTVSVQTVQLVPVAPAAVAPIFVESAAAGALTNVDLTLPFGLRAHISDLNGATIVLNQPEFPGSLTGGIQIKLQPPSPDNPTATFDGNAFVTAPYGTNVLDSLGDPSVSNFFDSRFGTSVPVRRYDLSGYGASIFSDWHNLDPGTADVTKVQFRVLVGRTAYDVVQIRSLIYPWAVRVVRTITIERVNLGVVVRHDSGWQAISNGDFQYPNVSTHFVLHLGAVPQLVNVRNIQANGAIFPLTGTPQWLPVTLDADVQLNPAITIDSGASGTNTVVSRGITGYLLETVTKPPFIPSANDVVTLLTSNRAAGPISCTVTIAASGTQLRGSGIDVAAFLDGARAVIVCALRGSPVLPPDGAWSIGKRSTASTSPPLPLDPNFPVPLVQNTSQPNVWYYADPTDVLNLPAGTPGSEYGLLRARASALPAPHGTRPPLLRGASFRSREPRVASARPIVCWIGPSL